MPDIETPPAEVDQVATPVEDTGSLADHEATFSGRQPSRTAEPPAEPKPAAKAEPPAADTGTERDEKGQFKPRHRAKSQEASPEDVPRIAALTKRLRETEDALKAEREARSKPAAEPPKPAERPAPPREKFPTFEKWAVDPANKDKDFDDWIDERSQFNYSQLRASEREQEARTAAEREWRDISKSYADKLPAIQKKYADFEDAVSTAPSVSRVVERAVIEVGPEAAYYLATHPEEAAALSDDTLVHPDNPAFKAAVASTRRYLQTLVAGEQRSDPPSRTAADSTGAALALVTKPTAKPPTPVRTGALRDADAPPGDDSDLSAHEKAFYKSRRA